MNQQWKTREIARILGFTVGLAVCGALSSRILQADLPRIGAYLVGLPFAWLCASFCARPWRRAPWAVVMIAAAWALAYITALWLHNDRFPDVAFLTAGLVGGLGVAAGMAVGAGACRSWRAVILTAAIGAGSAWPFGIYDRGAQAFAPWSEAAFLDLCFVVWQVSVGLCVYGLASLPRWRGEVTPGPVPL